ncbi:hypothetical protein ScalyP_jg8032, partial [Parmales sp. scaly parma]
MNPNDIKQKIHTITPSVATEAPNKQEDLKAMRRAQLKEEYDKAMALLEENDILEEIPVKEPHTWAEFVAKKSNNDNDEKNLT